MRLLLDLNGVLVFDTAIHHDERGHFRENWRTDHLVQQGVPESFFRGFMQNNVSVSHKGVIRGMHCQGWAKLMTVAIGSFRMVFVDLRVESEHYGKKVTLDVKPGMCIYVPEGVANGAQALEDNSVLNYIVTGAWVPGEKYLTIHPLSDELLELWLPIGPIVSEKDRKSPKLSDVLVRLKPDETISE